MVRLVFICTVKTDNMDKGSNSSDLWGRRKVEVLLRTGEECFVSGHRLYWGRSRRRCACGPGRNSKTLRSSALHYEQLNLVRRQSTLSLTSSEKLFVSASQKVGLSRWGDDVRADRCTQIRPGPRGRAGRRRQGAQSPDF